MRTRIVQIVRIYTLINLQQRKHDPPHPLSPEMMRLISTRKTEERDQKLARRTSRNHDDSREVQFLGRNKSQEYDWAGNQESGKRERKRYRGRQSSWELLVEAIRVPRNEVNRKEAICRRKEGEEEKVKVLRQWRRRGRPPERINTTLARRSDERVFRGSPSSRKKKRRKGEGTGFARLAVARMNNQTRRGR